MMPTEPTREDGELAALRAEIIGLRASLAQRDACLSSLGKSLQAGHDALRQAMLDLLSAASEQEAASLQRQSERQAALLLRFLDRACAIASEASQQQQRAVAESSKPIAVKHTKRRWLLSCLFGGPSHSRTNYWVRILPKT